MFCQLLAGLPLSTDEVSAEEQLMLLGLAETSAEATKMITVGQKERPPPQLYTGAYYLFHGVFLPTHPCVRLGFVAPDPEEDPEAQKAMENLATLAAQVYSVISGGNVVNNATKAVLNQTREFFQSGVMPKAGLDELDDFLLKKIGMLSHCGFDNEMKIENGTITKELWCAMRVHLMNESEIHVFCPADAKVFHENCQNVEFMNYTAISETNELLVVQAFTDTLHRMLEAYPSTIEEDDQLIEAYLNDHSGSSDVGAIMVGALQLRRREKELIVNTIEALKIHVEEITAVNSTFVFQLDLKRQEREEADKREAAHLKFMEEVCR